MFRSIHGRHNVLPESQPHQKWRMCLAHFHNRLWVGFFPEIQILSPIAILCRSDFISGPHVKGSFMKSFVRSLRRDPMGLSVDDILVVFRYNPGYIPRPKT